MRADLALIADHITPNSTLLDIGCGSGELLEYLAREKQIDGRGIELDQPNVSACVQRGLAVIQGDADTDLEDYPDQCFDYTVMTMTLQVCQRPKEVLAEMLRISKQAIISFPNFGHWRNRLFLLGRGRMPVTKRLSFEWYNTPNIHFCTIRDFMNLAEELGAKRSATFYLDSRDKPHHYMRCPSLANLFAEQAVFVLKKQ